MVRAPLRPKVAVLAWDVGHNPVGRAYVLADLLRERFDVEIWGTQFDRYGVRLWNPFRDSAVPIHVLEGKQFPAHLGVMEAAARRIDADLIWVSKPRLPSYGLGILAKEARHRPLVLDVDDHELAFFGGDDELEHRRIRRRSPSDLATPFGRSWTEVCEGLIDAADAVTTSNEALQDRYGGLIVPHVRDERVFDPGGYDRDEARHRLGVSPSDRLLLFGGTARAHKGLLTVLEALEDLGDERCRLGVFGTDELRRREIPASLGRWMLPIPPPRFDELASVVVAADLACVLQDASHAVSRYQMPAKIVDALAMSVPCVVSAVPPLRSLIDRDVVNVVDGPTPLSGQLAAILDGGDEISDRTARGRKLFLEELSYTAVRPAVTAQFTELLDEAPPLQPGQRDLIARLRRLYPGDGGGRPGAPRRVPGRPRGAGRGTEYDLVMFWKQNDTGIYGRRQDMFLSYLEQSGRFRTIVHFDRPITPEGLALLGVRALRHRRDQSRLVFAQTVRRLVGRGRGSLVHRHTYLYAGRRSVRLGFPSRQRYADYVGTILRRHGIGDRPTVFWVHPTDFDAPLILDTIDPDVVVADVVDDDRAWHPVGSKQRDRIERNSEAILGRSDIVLANCEPVAQRMRAFVPDVHVVPNGLELPSEPVRRGRPRPLRHLRGPIIGYAGNLSSRLDIDLLDEVVGHNPQWNFVFVGSAHGDRSILRLNAYPNVHFLGTRPFEEVRRLVEHFDVGLIPHLDDEMTRSMNPLKAYVYAAAGVPIVATPVSNLGELASLVSVAGGPGHFADAIALALAGGRRTVDREALAPHTWENRMNIVLGLIDEAMGVASQTSLRDERASERDSPDGT